MSRHVPTGSLKVETLTGIERKKRKKKCKRALYSQYLADSGSDDCSENNFDRSDTSVAYEFESFEPGMDINILIQQTVQNIVQNVTLEDYDGLSRFSDKDLISFSDAIKNNSSILSLQIKYLDVSDLSLIPLCRALGGHPSIRTLEISGTRGSSATVKAVLQLVCRNPGILFVKLDDTNGSPQDAEDIRLATLYNALACPDPTSNPFYLGLLRKISDMEEEKQKYKEQLAAQLWLFSHHSHSNQCSTKDKRNGFVEKAAGSRIGADVCAQFMSGKCTYGSRCRYIHPDKTAAVRNPINVSQYKVEHATDDDLKSFRSCSISTGQSNKIRLQSRLRPSSFTIKKVCHSTTSVRESFDIRSTGDEKTENPTIIRAVWVFSVIAVTCTSLLVVAYR